MKRILHISIALLLLLAVGQNAWATTKTVTYTLSREEVNQTKYWALTHSGDTPFDGTTTVEHQQETNATSATFQLPDGFTFTFTWGSGATVTSVGSGGSTSYFTCSNANIRFSLTWSTHRYVTAVSVTDDQGNPSALYSSGTASTAFTYSEKGQVSYTLKTYANFVKLNITYSNAPGLSIFESPSTDTYNIKSADDLRHLADYVNNGGNTCSGLTFQQTTNITCDATYTPIGDCYNYFSGTYNGQNYQISGITVSRTGSTVVDRYIGLFGQLNSGTVINVILANSTFTGDDNIGGIVGFNNGGTVENCRVKSDVFIYAGCDSAEHHGGIVGWNTNNSKVIGCISAATVSHEYKSHSISYGGIVGFHQSGTIKNCLYTGTTVTANDNKGAIVGFKSNTLTTLTNNYYTNISLGGVNSADQDGARRAYTVTLGNNVSLAGAETAYSTSGLTAIGTGNYALRSGSTTYSGEGQTLTLSYTGGDVPVGKALRFSYNDGSDHAIDGNSFTMPAHNVTVSATLVDDLWGIITDGADGSAEKPYRISTLAGLDLLAQRVNSGTGDEYAASGYSGKHFRQAKDLTYDGTENNYTAIGTSSHPFSGHYDGNENTISGININKTGTDANADSYQGLFGYVDGGTIEKLALAGSTIVGYQNVGGIVGYLKGTVQNCRVENNVTISKGTNDNSSINFGGVVGQSSNGDTFDTFIQGCVCGATVTGIKTVGGIVGSSGGTLRSNVYFGTSVSTGTNCGAILGSGRFSYNNYYTATSGVPKGIGTNSNTGIDTPPPTFLTSYNGENASYPKLLTLGEHVAIDGAEVEYSFSGLTDLGDKALRYDDGNSVRTFTHTWQTVTFRYEGKVPDGKSVAFRHCESNRVRPISGTAWSIKGSVTSAFFDNYDAFSIYATLVSDQVTITGKPALGGYWATFYSSASYNLPKGTVAYIMESNGQLHPLAANSHYGGLDGKKILGCVAVVLFSDKESITLTRSNEKWDEDVLQYENILLGSDDPVPVVNGKVDGKTPYVLGVVDGVFGFHPFTGSEIPANKAYYLLTP